MKKIISIALALILLVSVGTVAVTTASADTTATVNGKSANIGDRVTYDLYFKCDQKLEDFQGYITYDSSVLELVGFDMPNVTIGGMYNTTYAGFVYHSGSSYNQPYDFTTEKLFLQATFTVVKAGTTSIASVWEDGHDINSVPIVNGEQGTLTGSASERMEVTVSIPPSSSDKPNPTNSKPTNSKPTLTPDPTSPTGSPSVVKVSSVTLNAKTKTLNVGKSFTLKASCKPSNASNKSVSWSTTNPKVVVVNRYGKVTAKSKGTAYVKATARDGSKKYARCKITVKQPVTKIKLSVKKKVIKVKKKFKIKATVSPAKANVKTVKWTVNKKKIVKLSKTKSASGKNIKVTAKKRGKVTLKATAMDGSKRSASCKITVKKK